jgi:hypothetical protein
MQRLYLSKTSSYRQCVKSTNTLRTFTTRTQLFQQSNLQKNIARDFNPQKQKQQQQQQQQQLPDAIPPNLTFDEMKKLGYETRGDYISKRISVHPNSIPHSMAFYSLLTTLPVITGSAMFAFASTTNPAIVSEASSTNAETVAETVSWISNEMLMNYQLNYSALLLVSYAAIHLGLNYGAFHLPPVEKKVVIDKSAEAQEQKRTAEEQQLVNESILAETNRERTELLTRSKYSIDSPVGWGRLALALYPIGFAFSTFSIPVIPATIILVSGHLITALVDTWMSYRGLAPRWYPAVRLTCAVVIISSLSISLFFYLFSTAINTMQVETKQMEDPNYDNTVPPTKPSRGERPKMQILTKAPDITEQLNRKKRDALEDDKQDDEIDFEKALKEVK